YSALLDRLEGKDANNITQCYTDIAMGRPTIDQHRHPEDDLRKHYDRNTAAPISRLNALTIFSAEYQIHDFYMNLGPTYADPVARALYAEILSIEEQHVTQYGSIIDPNETWLEKWLLHEANEVYNYYSCLQGEPNPRIKKIWERFLDYELGHLHVVMELFKQHERRDPAEILPAELPEPIRYESHREFVRQVLNQEVELTVNGTDFVPGGLGSKESPATREYRHHINRDGSPSDTVAAEYIWRPGTELSDRHAAPGSPCKEVNHGNPHIHRNQPHGHGHVARSRQGAAANHQGAHAPSGGREQACAHAAGLLRLHAA